MYSIRRIAQPTQLMQTTQPSSKNVVLSWAQKVVHFKGKMGHSGTFSFLSAPEGFWRALGGARDGPILDTLGQHPAVLEGAFP